MFGLENIPEDLREAFFIKMCPYIGMEAKRKFDAAVKKYPEHFPWETTYNSLPQEVHDAYFKASNPWHDKPWEPITTESGEPFIGLIPTIMKQAKEPIPESNEPPKSILEIFKEVFDAQEESRKRKIEEYNKDKSLWDKHYKKYGLEYRMKFNFWS